MAGASTREIPPELSIASFVRNSTPQIDLGGELDMAGRSAVRQVIDDVLERAPRRVVLDLSRLTFMDSTGVHLVNETRDRAAATQIELVLIPGPPAVQRVFEIANNANDSLACPGAEPSTQGAADESR